MNGSIVLKGLPVNCSDLDIRHALGDVVEIQMNYAQQTAVVRLRYPATAQAILQQGRVHINNVVVSVEQQQQAPPPQQQASAAPYSSSYASSAPSYYHQSHHHQMQHQPMMQQQQQQQQASSNSLQVVVDGCTYPITQDVLTQVFSRIARPIDIACGPTGTTTVARVTLPDAASAMRAIAELNNKCIYPNCCTMKVSMEAAPSYSLMPPATAAPSYQSYTSQGYDMQHQQHMSTGGGRGGFDSPAGPYGSMMRGGRGRGRGMMMGSMDAPGFAQGGRGGYNQQQPLPYGFQHGHHHQHHQHQHHLQHQHHQHHQHQHHQQHGGGSQQFGDAPVVIVTGVPESVPLHNLWVLLEVYGNVKWLKRQHTNAQNVVAQFQNLHDARSVLVHLQGCPFYGSTLQLKHFAGYVERTSSRTEWNSGPATDPATTAFLFDSCHHRTKPSAPYNPKQKSRPEANLFVANLSDDITDEDVQNTFAAHGFPLVAFYRKSPVTAIVQCESVPKAVEALIAVHAAKLNERFISVAFSRYPPGPPPANSAHHANGDNTASAGGDEAENGVVAPVGGGNEEPTSFAAAEQAPLPSE